MGFDGEGNYERTNGTFDGPNLWVGEANVGNVFSPVKLDIHNNDIAKVLIAGA